MKNTEQNKIEKILLRYFNKMYNHFGPLNWWPGDSPFEVMVGAVLTQNTSWSNVEKAISNLKQKGYLDPYKILDLSLKELAEIVKPSGFFNVKAKRLKSLIYFFVKEYDADIRKMLKDDLFSLRKKLLSVNGIGKETADSILLYALNKPILVIDAYTKRIFSRHGIISEEMDYDDLQSFFMRHLPQDVSLYNEYHAQIVLTGKTYCRKKPLCEKCPLKDE
ncbi:MAG TPA: endonuclease III domain-containing protein [Candidatus Atribacteria bacterium]|nr:endonuclease III domain-containing protein [Candidatus Atribacteria bacterium]